MAVASFTSLLIRLSSLRMKLIETLREKGVEVADSDMLTALVRKTQLIDSNSGMNQIRNGYQLFKDNRTMIVFPTFDTATFDSMYQMCYGCTALERIPFLDTAKVYNMMYAFYACTNLTEIAGLDTSQIASASEMFHGCVKLRKIGGVLDFSKVRSQIDSTFVSCSALEEVTFVGTITVDIAMNGCPKLTVDSLLSLLDALSAGVTNRECRIGAKNLSKLSIVQQAIATNKGWTLI